MPSIISYIGHAIAVPGLILQVIVQLKKQRAFMSEHLAAHLQKIKATNDGTVQEKDIRKIENYYGIAVPAILGEAYARLRGYPLTFNERMACTCIGSATGLFDDFFEQQILEDDYIEKLYTHPQEFSGGNDNERLANYFWVKALENCANPQTLTTYALKVHFAQIQSRLQVIDGLSEDAIRQITFDKGGYSLLFYRAAFEDTLSDKDRQLFYNIGALGQLENDIFDVYKDSREGIYTLMTMGNSIDKIKKEYEQLWLTIKQQIANSQYSAYRKLVFQRTLFAVLSRGLVCLDMLAKLPSSPNSAFDPSKFSRQELICDMENPANLLNSIYCFIKNQ